MVVALLSADSVFRENRAVIVPSLRVGRNLKRMSMNGFSTLLKSFDVFDTLPDLVRNLEVGMEDMMVIHSPEYGLKSAAKADSCFAWRDSKRVSSFSQALNSLVLTPDLYLALFMENKWMGIINWIDDIKRCLNQLLNRIECIRSLPRSLCTRRPAFRRHKRLNENSLRCTPNPFRDPSPPLRSLFLGAYNLDIIQFDRKPVKQYVYNYDKKRVKAHVYKHVNKGRSRQGLGKQPGLKLYNTTLVKEINNSARRERIPVRRTTRRIL